MFSDEGSGSCVISNWLSMLCRSTVCQKECVTNVRHTAWNTTTTCKESHLWSWCREKVRKTLHPDSRARTRSSWPINWYGVQAVRIDNRRCESYSSNRRTYSSNTDCPRGVPQGSVLDPLLFVASTAPMSIIASDYGVQYHQYADDIQLYVAISTSNLDPTITNLQNYLSTEHSPLAEAKWTYSKSWQVWNCALLNRAARQNIAIATNYYNRSMSLDQKCHWLTV